MEPTMDLPILNIAVIGANGGIGRQLVLQALNAGHKVTAILRTPANLTIAHPNLKIVKGDVMHGATLDEALENTEVVISAIGHNSIKKTTLYSLGNKNLIAAMKRAGANHAFFISASGLEVNPTHSVLIRFSTKYILQSVLRNMYADLRVMEKIIKESNLNWTIMRPPRLLDAPVTGIYRTSSNGHLNNGLKIARADVAHFIVHNLTNGSIHRKKVEIAY